MVEKTHRIISHFEVRERCFCISFKLLGNLDFICIFIQSESYLENKAPPLQLNCFYCVVYLTVFQNNFINEFFISFCFFNCTTHKASFPRSETL